MQQSYDAEIMSFEPTIMKPGAFDPKTLRVTRKGRNEYVMTGDFSLLINLGEDSVVRRNREVNLIFRDHIQLCYSIEVSGRSV